MKSTIQRAWGSSILGNLPNGLKKFILTFPWLSYDFLMIFSWFSHESPASLVQVPYDSPRHGPGLPRAAAPCGRLPGGDAGHLQLLQRLGGR